MVQERVQAIQETVRNFVIAGLATCATANVVGGGVPAAEAHSAASDNVPEAATDIIHHNAARLTQLGCSAWLLRGKRDEIDGVVTAVHCNLTDQAAPRLIGSDGKQYIVKPKAVKAQTGAETGHLKTVATIDRYVLPGTSTAPDQSHDLAIGVAQGHTAAEALADYHRTAIPATELKPGDKLYAGAYPQAHPANPTRHTPRQSFDMTDVTQGYEPVNTQKPKVHMVFAGMPATKDGAECSYGASGDVAFKLSKRNPKVPGIVGALSWFNDFTGALGVDKTIRALNPNAVVAICGYSDELAEPKLNNAAVVTTVNAETKVPGYLSIEQLMQTARDKFNNPAIQKTILSGKLALPGAGGGKGGGSDTELQAQFIDDPVLFHVSNADRNITLIGGASPADPDHLRFTFFTDQDLGQALVYSHDPAQAPAFSVTNGAIEYRQDDPAQPSGSFVDASQQRFGVQSQSSSNLPPQTYSLYFDGTTYKALLNGMK